MDQYEIVQMIDEGAYGIVYKARHKMNNRLYAIKKFKDLSTNSSAERLITRQIIMLRNLKSKYIVKMKQVLRKSDRTYIVFEYAGRNLLKFIEEGSLKVQSRLQQQSDIVRIIYQVLKGLAYMHNRNIMHRDIKPENIMVQQDKVKLCDLGFARSQNQIEHRLTTYVATRWYRAPEILLRMPYGKPTDMWALGCLICEMIDGRPLFPGQSEIDQLYLIQRALGNLTAQQMKVLQRIKLYEGFKFPEFSPRNIIKQRFFLKASKKLITLIELCLKMNPNQRITPEQALNLPVFQSLRLQSLAETININPTSDLSRKTSSIYNSHLVKESIYKSLSRRANSQTKIPPISQYLSTDMQLRGREQFNSVQMNKMREEMSKIYSKKLLTLGKKNGRLVE